MTTPQKTRWQIWRITFDIFSKIYQGRVVIGVSQVDKMPERDFVMYRDWLTNNNKSLPIFPVDMRKKQDVLLLVDTIIAFLEIDSN